MKKWIILAAVMMLAVVVAVFGQSCTAYTEKQSEDLARDFVEKCPTFVFDGLCLKCHSEGAACSPDKFFGRQERP